MFEENLKQMKGTLHECIQTHNRTLGQQVEAGDRMTDLQKDWWFVSQLVESSHLWRTDRDAQTQLGAGGGEQVIGARTAQR